VIAPVRFKVTVRFLGPRLLQRMFDLYATMQASVLLGALPARRAVQSLADRAQVDDFGHIPVDWL